MYNSLLLIISLLLVAFSAFNAQIPLKDKNEHKGVLLLDSLTFPKIVPSEKHDVVVLICNKAKIGDYGTDSIRSDYFSFAGKASVGGEADNVLFTQIIVNGGENKALAARIGMEKNFEHPRMFVYPAGSDNAIIYPESEPFQTRALSQFLGRHSSLYMKISGTLRMFDDLAVKFMESPEDMKSSVIEEAQTLSDNSSEDERPIAEYYIKVMSKIADQGVSYLENEIKRIKTILADKSKTSQAKRKMFNKNLNVLYHFFGYTEGLNIEL